VRQKVDYSSMIANFPSSIDDYAKIHDSNSIAELLNRDLQLTITQSTTPQNFTVKHGERICDWNSSKTLELLERKDKILRKRRKKRNSTKIKEELLTVSRALKNSIHLDFRRHIDHQLSSRDP
jgi:hypothetical protein